MLSAAKRFIMLCLYANYNMYRSMYRLIKAAPYDENIQFRQFLKFNLYEAI